MIDVNKELETFFNLLEDGPEEAVDAGTRRERQGEKSDYMGDFNGEEVVRCPRVGVDRFDRPAVFHRPRPVNPPTRVVPVAPAVRYSPNQFRMVGAMVVVSLLAGLLTVSVGRLDSQLGSRFKTFGGQAIGATPTIEAALTVTTEPTGARVFLDGELVGVSPFEGVRVSPGRYAMRMERTGFAAVDTAVFLVGVHSTSISMSRVEAAPETVGRAGSARSGSEDSQVPDNGASLRARALVIPDSTTVAVVKSDSLDSPGLVLAADSGASYIERDSLSVVGSTGGFEQVAALPVRLASSIPQHAAVEIDRAIGAGSAGFEIASGSFEALESRGDRLFASGRYMDAAGAYEEASRLRPSLSSIVRKISAAHKAAELEELPSAVFTDGVGDVTD